MKNVSIFAAKYTDNLGNVRTLKVGKRDNDTQWVEMSNQKGVSLCISSAYCGLSNEGTAGQRNKISSAAKAATSSANLAKRLRAFGFPFQAVR